MRRGESIRTEREWMKTGWGWRGLPWGSGGDGEKAGSGIFREESGEEATEGSGSGTLTRQKARAGFGGQ